MSDTLDAALIEACKRGDMAEAERLVEGGAKINQSGSSGPLFYAAYHGHPELTRWLFDQGADLDIRNSGNSTPLMGAAEQGMVDCVRVLLEAGADTELANTHSMTARKYGAENATITALFANPPALVPRKVSTDEITFSWRVNNRTLQETFNFEHKERVTFIRLGATGPVEAVTRETFAELADKSALRRAFDEYKKRGGTREEAEVFHDALPNKARLKPKEM